jgi:hypothetical protein
VPSRRRCLTEYSAGVATLAAKTSAGVPLDPESDAAYFRQGKLRPHVLGCEQRLCRHGTWLAMQAAARRRRHRRPLVHTQCGHANSSFRVPTFPGPQCCPVHSVSLSRKRSLRKPKPKLRQCGLKRSADRFRSRLRASQVSRIEDRESTDSGAQPPEAARKVGRFQSARAVSGMWLCGCIQVYGCSCSLYYTQHGSDRERTEVPGGEGSCCE